MLQRGVAPALTSARMKGISDELASHADPHLHRGLQPGQGRPALGDALLAAWPCAAAVLDAERRLLTFNDAFAALAGSRLLLRGHAMAELLRDGVIPAPGLVERPLGGGWLLLEWSEEAAAMAEARRLCGEEMAERLQRLATADDLPAIHAEAHGLRGLAANFGLATLLEPLRDIELACRAGRLPDVRGALAELTHRAAPALEALRRG